MSQNVGCSAAEPGERTKFDGVHDGQPFRSRIREPSRLVQQTAAACRRDRFLGVVEPVCVCNGTRDRQLPVCQPSGQPVLRRRLILCIERTPVQEPEQVQRSLVTFVRVGWSVIELPSFCG